MICLQIPSLTVNNLLAAGWTIVNGPHATQGECVANCGGGSSSSANSGSADCPCPDGGPNIFDWTAPEGSGDWGGGTAGGPLNRTGTPCTWFGTIIPFSGFYTLELTVTSLTTATLVLTRAGGGQAVYQFNQFQCCNSQSSSLDVVITQAFPPGTVPPIYMQVLAGPC